MKKSFYVILGCTTLVLIFCLLKYLTIGKALEKYDIKKYILSESNFKKQGKKGVNITFLGTSSFILEYKDKKLITDPFFSNPEFLKGCIVATPYPSLENYLNKTIYQNSDMIVISHGHYDHCIDIQNFLSDKKQTTIVAEKHIMHEIAAVQKNYKVRFDTSMNEEFKYSNDSTFRVLPIKSKHSPHFAKVTLFTGEYQKPLAQFPDRLFKWKLHSCYSYLIDILENNAIVCRFLFVCGELDTPSVSSIKKWCATYPADILLNVYWKDKVCSQTLDNAYYASNPQHIILHHWNNFFKDTKKGVEVLRTTSLEKAIKKQHQRNIPTSIMLPMSTIQY